MAKRSHSTAIGSSDESPSLSDAKEHSTGLGPWSKRLLSSTAEPVSFMRVRSLDELNRRALQLQNKKLWVALTDQRATIAELRERAEQLENRRAKDDALLCVIDRYWNQLDEDCLILLQRSDSDVDESISSPTESFLKQLSSWDSEEVPEKLQERVHFSKRIVAKLLSTYDRLVTRQSRLRHLLSKVTEKSSKSSSSGAPSEILSSESSGAPEAIDKPGGVDQLGGEPRLLSAGETGGDDDYKETTSKSWRDRQAGELQQLVKENQCLQTLCSQLHEKHRQNSLRLRKLQDLAQTRSDAAAEWQAKYEDLDYKLSEAMTTVSCLDHRLYDSQQRCKQLEMAAAKETTESPSASEELNTGSNLSGSSINRTKYNELACELEEMRELAANRLSELERLQRQLEEKVGECASLSMKLRETPESVIFESPQYTSLKTQFNLVYNEATQMRGQLEELRATLQSNRQNHLKQIEEMESNEAAIQHQMRSEMLLIESQFSQLRRAHETMELDFKQAVAHNEQAGPINSEMRSLISTLQTHNKQLKAEISRSRYKISQATEDLTMAQERLKSTEDELSQVRQALHETTVALKTNSEMAETRIAEAKKQALLEKQESSSSAGKVLTTTAATMTSVTQSVDAMVSTSVSTATGGSSDVTLKMEESVGRVDRDCEPCPTCRCPSNTQDATVNVGTTPPSLVSACPDETIRELRDQLKRSQESQKEMSVLLNMYKVIPKDQRDKAALLQCESKLRSELAEAKVEIDRLQSSLANANSQLAKSQHRKLSLSSPSSVSIKASPSHQISHPVSPTTVGYQINELRIELQLTRRRCQSLEEQVDAYHQRLAVSRQQEDVILKEMEVTGQAFEDVQDQNARLVVTLREKDDAGLKLMTERHKTAQLARLLKEDKHLLEEQIKLMQAKVEALNRSVSKQEEKERLLLSNLSTLEKGVTLLQQAQEAYKRKSLENQQIADDLRVTVQKYQSQLKEAHTSVQEKAGAFERISFRHQRLQEELITIRRRYERLRKIEQSHNADEVLLAEIQDYKEQLTCPTCKTNRKDAILTKCFHVFCLNCLKTRYETRNRKCPKCNATFGANDYHRIYLC